MLITMNDEQEVQRLEILCKQLYESQDAAQRNEAEKTLILFQESSNSLNNCQLLLERADSPYSQLLAATAVSKMLMRNHEVLDVGQRLDIRNYVLNYLATRMKLQHFVVQALVSLYAKITKISWFDTCKNEYVFRSIDDVSKFLTGSVEHCLIGIQLLSQLTSEMNQVTEVEAYRAANRMRRVASSFRDLQLLDIFKLACKMLTSTNENIKPMNFGEHDGRNHNVVVQLLKLAYNCLTFDFIGTISDESADDLSTVQIPTSWRSFFSNMCTLDLFFGFYHSLPASDSSITLACLVQLASVRRSLFNNPERAKFLQQLMTGIQNILLNPASLSEPNNYHEFCRLLSRLKANYQLNELVAVPNYPETIRLIAKFTVESLQMWQFAPNSVYYLLSLWQRMISSIPYLKSMEPHLLDSYAFEITKAYITSRLEAVPIIVRDNLDDPLDDSVLIQQQLEQLTLIGRCDYEKTIALVLSCFDQSANNYQELVTKDSKDAADIVNLKIQEGRLSWLVNIIGWMILSRGSTCNHDAKDHMDGEIVCRVFQLMTLTDSRLSQNACEKLEMAVLNFFDCFRKVYIGEQVNRTSSVYKTLGEIMGLTEESVVLSVYIRKIITNLKFWSGNEKIVEKTLVLLRDLSSGHSSVRKIVKLEDANFFLDNHSRENFEFLSNTMSASQMRCRSSFYTSVGRLLLIHLNEDDSKFYKFIEPLTSAFDEIAASMIACGEKPSPGTPFANNDTKMALIGIARDLRGLAFALNTKTSYMMFFDWIFPNYTQLLIRALEIWYYDPHLTTPILKLFSELVHNRAQRLEFDVSSPNGILLFREISKAVCAFGSRIINVEVQKSQLYTLKLKGISLCFWIIKSAFCGSYVNFGIFRLYGDDAVDNMLNMFVNLFLAIPKNELMVYQKLAQAYFMLLECLAQDHIEFLTSLEPQVFLYILSIILNGMSSTDSLISTGCCSTLDYIVTYLFKLITKKMDIMSGKKPKSVLTPNSEVFIEMMEANTEILQQLMMTAMNIVIFEECRNVWSVSRPLLGLILLNEDYFNKLRQEIIQNQTIERKPIMAVWFDKLMTGIERNLLNKNRDAFTHNLSRFRQEISDTIKTPSDNSVSASDTSSLPSSVPSTSAAAARSAAAAAAAAASSSSEMMS